MRKSLVFDRGWTKNITPGHCFVWFNSERRTLYSMVVEQPPEETSPPDEKTDPQGYVFTKTFNQAFPDGFHCYVRRDLPALLLSEEQMALARKLGWPEEEEGIQQVFDVESS
jgi:hypothetical protein